MTNLYVVIGEHHDDPDRYLVLGADGDFYEWDLTSEQTIPIEPGEEWSIDPDLRGEPVQFEDVFIDP
jgi:hypothetical protein